MAGEPAPDDGAAIPRQAGYEQQRETSEQYRGY